MGLTMIEDDPLRVRSCLMMLAYEALGEPRTASQLGENYDTVIIIIETIGAATAWNLDQRPQFEFQSHQIIGEMDKEQHTLPLTGDAVGVDDDEREEKM